MDPLVSRALGHGHVIDITTTGRVTGAPRRIEIVFHNLDGRIYISGIPNPHRQRAWLRNLEVDPRFTVHLKGPVRADLPATARVITDPEERRAILPRIARIWHRDPEPMILYSPLIEALIEGYPSKAAA
jgi:deazaflavin-dependent oxidoreductase (nitroreductase family)